MRRLHQECVELRMGRAGKHNILRHQPEVDGIDHGDNWEGPCDANAGGKFTEPFVPATEDAEEEEDTKKEATRNLIKAENGNAEARLRELEAPKTSNATCDKDEAQKTLMADKSFEMFDTVGEVKLNEEKKALQKMVRALQQELEESKRPQGLQSQCSPPVAASPPLRQQLLVPRQLRRLQHTDAIMARLHEEICRRGGVAGGNAPPSPSPATRTSDVSVALNPPQVYSPAPASEKAISIGTSFSRSTNHSLRVQHLDKNIKALSHRFLLVRDMR